MSDLIRLEILEDRLLDGTMEYFKGDVKSFPAEKAKRWCSLGWAQDVSGTVPTAERKPGAAPIVPDTASLTI